MPVDVFPDLTAPTVTVVAEAHGMAPEEVEKVFKPFYRAGRQRGGHGVGLTIVKRLSDRFGWPVHVESSPGVGTRVTVGFPTGRVEPVPVPS